MPQRRRLTFQLTPLLDLLLIVIFAQYMEVQHTAESGEALLQSQQAQLEQQFQQRKQELETVHAATMQQVEQSRLAYSEKFQSILDQQHQAGSTLAKTFNLPGRAMEEVLRLRTAGKSTDADKLEQAVSQLKELLESRSEELLQFMIRYDEMQKHVSVWELHLLDNGQAMFTNGRLSQRLSFESTTEFISTCFEASKAFEEPHPLTLILMTYGDTQAGVRRNVVDGLPDLVQRLRTDTGGTRWFDYSLMGFRPNGPLMNPDSIQP